MTIGKFSGIDVVMGFSEGQFDRSAAAPHSRNHYTLVSFRIEVPSVPANECALPAELTRSVSRCGNTKAKGVDIVRRSSRPFKRPLIGR